MRTRRVRRSKNGNNGNSKNGNGKVIGVINGRGEVLTLKEAEALGIPLPPEEEQETGKNLEQNPHLD